MNELLEQGMERGLDRFGRAALREALNQTLDRFRARLRRATQQGGSEHPGIDAAFWAEVDARLAVTPALSLRRAVNATGVVLHTGLGRAPWPAEAMAASVAAARGAVLEIEPDSGGRGRRELPVARRICALTGAEAALAVNNNAAAVLLALSALARGRKVLLSRGEMVEIGGSYRMPEVVEAAGAELVEVGTTNRTHAADFTAALADPAVGCVLKVHPSNFRIGGFRKEVSIEELAPLCRERGVPLVYDLGSGILGRADLPGCADEPGVRDALRAGADLVCFSGDKLLGGPQAGLIAGAAPLVERLRRDMLTRCLRLDKTILAALEAVLSLHALGEDAARQRIPALRMLAEPVEEVRARAERCRSRLDSQSGGRIKVQLTSCESRVGSGAAPQAPIPSAGLLLQVDGAASEELARRLRQAAVPLFGRLQDDQVLLDFRTLGEGEEDALLRAVLSVIPE